MAKDAATRIVESTLKSITASKVDRDAGIIYGVRLGGLDSKNKTNGLKRKYSPAAYKNALPLYEGRPCNINHVKEGEDARSEDRFGVWHNARWAESPAGPIADLHYLKSHPMAERVCEAAERPDLGTAFGMSHDGHAKDTRRDSGFIVIESFANINSVDLVANPSTVKGLYESTEPKPMKQTCKQLIEAAYNLPLHAKLLEKFSKSDEAAYKRLTEEIEPSEGASVQESAEAAFRHVIVSVATDAEASEVGKLVESVRKLQYEMLHGAEPAVVKESVEVKAESFGVREATSYCASLKFTPTPHQLTLISESTAANGKEIAKELCRLSLNVKETEVKAGSKGEPVKESTSNQKPASSTEELAKRIR